MGNNSDSDSHVFVERDVSVRVHRMRLLSLRLRIALHLAGQQSGSPQGPPTLRQADRSAREQHCHLFRIWRR